MKRPFYILGWVYVAACSWLIIAHARVRSRATSGGSSVYAAPTTDAVQWFRRVKPYCNSVEVQTVQQQSPPPNTAAGAGYHAACYALAGRIDDARRVIDQLSPDDRFKAAGIVFDVGHPVADAGDDQPGAGRHIDPTEDVKWSLHAAAFLRIGDGWPTA